MSRATRQLILRINAIYLGGFGAVALVFMDIGGIFFDIGPAASVVRGAPYTGIGFVEAHGLALILAVLLWRAQPERSWHLTGAAVCLLLGTANLVFWQLFVVTDSLPMGYVTTTLHWVVGMAQLAAAALAPAERARRDLSTAAAGSGPFA